MNLFDKTIKIAERTIIYILIVLMAIVLVFASIEVGIIVIKTFVNSIQSSNLLIDINGLMEIFGFFLIVLIGFELFETVKLYIKENVFHGEVILLVSLIAVSRKVIVLDYSNEEPLLIFAIASLVVSVSVGYYLVKKTHNGSKEKDS